MNTSFKFWLCVALAGFNLGMVFLNPGSSASWNSLTAAGFCGFGAFAFWVVDNSAKEK